MIAWINLVVLVISTVLGLYFYVQGTNPRKLDQMTDRAEWLKLIKHQTLAELLMALVGINYVIYFLYPIPLSIPQTFPWTWGISATIAIVIGLFSNYYWCRSLPLQLHPTMILGQHHQIQDPQVISDLTFWWVLGFLLNSPFLVLFSFTWIPIYLLLNWWENKDGRNAKNLSTQF